MRRRNFACSHQQVATACRRPPCPARQRLDLLHGRSDIGRCTADQARTSDRDTVRPRSSTASRSPQAEGRPVPLRRGRSRVRSTAPACRCIAFKKADLKLPRTLRRPGSARSPHPAQAPASRRPGLLPPRRQRLPRGDLPRKKKHGKRIILHAPYSGQRVQREAIWTNSWFAATLRIKPLKR